MHQGHLPSPAGSWKPSRDGSGLDADGSASTAHKQQPNKHQDQYNNRRVKRSARETSYDVRRKGRGNWSGRYGSGFQKGSGTERLRTKGLRIGIRGLEENARLATEIDRRRQGKR